MNNQFGYSNAIGIQLEGSGHVFVVQSHHIMHVTNFLCDVTNVVTNFVTEFVTLIYTSLGKIFLIRNVSIIDSKRSYESGMFKNMLGRLDNQI